MLQPPKTSGYENARKDAETELGYVKSERVRLMGELAELDLREARALKMLNAARECLGEVVPEVRLTIESENENNQNEDGLSFVAKNQFRGMGPAKAARKYLEILGHGETHSQLVKALEKGSVRTGSKRRADSFRTSLQRRPDWFVFKKEKGEVGRWELVEWQNTGAAASENPADSQPGTRSLSLGSGAN
jgi:hypothetical protein